MGNKNSSPGSTQPQQPSSTSTTATPAAAQASTSPPPPKQETPAPKSVDPCDVVISATPGDSALVKFLKNKIEGTGCTVFSNTSTSDDDTRLLGRMLVDAKVLVFFMSEESSHSAKYSDQVSLAYISNKPILLATRKSKEQIMPTISFGLKLTLQNLAWTVFDSDTPDDATVNQFLQSVQSSQDSSNDPSSTTTGQSLEGTTQSSTQSAKQQRMRLNTKLRTATATSLPDPDALTADTFWERNFGDDDSVPWFRFQQAFLTDFDTQLKSLFPENQIPWLLDMLQNDIFGGASDISKSHFHHVRGDSKEKNAFWRAVSQIAVERYNMQEVFNMQSTVRLTAVESLGKFHNPAVVNALLRLLDDEDANIRAVAAISLGRTGVKDEEIIDKLIEKLKDGDRIVRQSVCLSLGALKAKKAIPHISNLWRNDFISVVRDAARTALQKMGVPEAEEVLKVTRILEDEIKHLEGNISSV